MSSPVPYQSVDPVGRPVVGTAAPGQNRAAQIVVGSALVVPALIALLWSYVLPTAATLNRSFQNTDLMRPAEQVGGDNYRQLLDNGFLGSVGFALLLGLLPLLCAVLVAPALAALADRAGPAARLTTRALLAVPIAAYAPVAVLLGWRVHRIDLVDLTQDPRGTLVQLVAASSFGLAVAVAATLFLSALRGRTPGRGATGAMLTVGAVITFGILALTLQTFTAPQLITGGGPRRSTATPLLDVVTNSLARLEVGLGSAGSILLLVPIALLGLATVGLLLVTRTRIEFDGWRRPTDDRGRAGVPGLTDDRERTNDQGRAGGPAGRALPGFLVAFALLGFVVAVGWALAPWLRHAFDLSPELPGGASATTALSHTWLPPLISTIVSLWLAVAAGFGIGALRPLGRWSELLLLPFAPWLFVGTGPLAVDGFVRARDAGQLDSFLGLIPPGWVSIPALVVFTLFFRAQGARWRAGAGFGRTLILPTLPMVFLAGLLMWLVSSQQVLWAQLVAIRPAGMPAPLLAQVLAVQRGQLDGGDLGLGLLLPLPLLLLFLVAFVALQIGYLDRLAIRVGRTEDGHE